MLIESCRRLRGPKSFRLVALKKKKASSSSSNLASPSYYRAELSTSDDASHIFPSSPKFPLSSSAYELTGPELSGSKDIVNNVTEPAPAYYLTDTHNHQIGVRITRRPMSPPPFNTVVEAAPKTSLSVPDSCETFSLSTFSYYGGSVSQPLEPPPISPSLSTFAPEPPLLMEPESLPPPPRRGPRHAGSSGSVWSAMTAIHGRPEDVGVAQSRSGRLLNPLEIGVLVTVERKRSDETA